MYERASIDCWRDGVALGRLSGFTDVSEAVDISQGDVRALPEGTPIWWSLELHRHAAWWRLVLHQWRAQAHRQVAKRRALHSLLLEATHVQLPSYWRRLIMGVAIARRERLARWAARPTQTADTVSTAAGGEEGEVQAAFPAAPALGGDLNASRWLHTLFHSWRSESRRSRRTCETAQALWEDACLVHTQEFHFTATLVLGAEKKLKYVDAQKRLTELLAEAEDVSCGSANPDPLTASLTSLASVASSPLAAHCQSDTPPPHAFRVANAHAGRA